MLNNYLKGILFVPQIEINGFVDLNEIHKILQWKTQNALNFSEVRNLKILLNIVTFFKAIISENISDWCFIQWRVRF